MIIRLLESQDSITALTQLLHAAYAQLGEMGFNYTAVDQTDDVTRERISLGECLIAIDGTTIVGTIMLYAPGQSKGCACYAKSNVSTIGQFGVLPEYQSRGVGKHLLNEAERHAVTMGATELALDTSEGATQLIAWYERQGFRVVEHAQWMEKTYRSVIMSKPFAAGYSSVEGPYALLR